MTTNSIKWGTDESPEGAWALLAISNFLKQRCEDPHAVEPMGIFPGAHPPVPFGT
jgi:hypothetical protein